MQKAVEAALERATQGRCYTERNVSSFNRTAFALVVPLLAVAAALALGVLHPFSAQQFSATASETASVMKLQISGSAASCDDFENPTKCSIMGGEEFTIAVAVGSLPAGASGYIGFQSLLYYGDLVYNPNADIANEIV